MGGEIEEKLTLKTNCSLGMKWNFIPVGGKLSLMIE